MPPAFAAVDCHWAIRQAQFFSEHPTLQQSLSEYNEAELRMFLLDYDGTLASSSNSADTTHPSQRLKEIISRLSAHKTNFTFVVTGRDDVWLEKELGDIPHLGLSAEHGLYLRLPFFNSEWRRLDIPKPLGLDHVQEVVRDFVLHHPETRLVLKRESVAWSFSGIGDREYGKTLREILRPLLQEAIEGTNLRMEDSNSGIEILSKEVNKSVAVHAILRQVLEELTFGSKTFAMTAGDGAADLPMFSEVGYDFVGQGVHLFPVGTKILERTQRESPSWGVSPSHVHPLASPEILVEFLDVLSRQ